MAGGQLTSQAVPPDEHRWIENSGSTATYREFRNRVREYYRRNYPLTESARNNPLLNPGNGWVSRLAHEPKVALSVLHEMLAPYVHSGRIEVLYYTVPVHAETAGDEVTAVMVLHTVKGTEIKLKGAYYLDATECGDLLPLAGWSIEAALNHAMRQGNRMRWMKRTRSICSRLPMSLPSIMYQAVILR